ncbi:hypothetical protein EVU45_22625, partial [Salmonella enterica subsp. enterica serovar Enteritidis]|nr:hypothetical protein [Salmonella enterica subsp. enterica serovar Enteritidis]
SPLYYKSQRAFLVYTEIPQNHLHVFLFENTTKNGFMLLLLKKQQVLLPELSRIYKGYALDFP